MMGYFKNVLNLKNVIVDDRASIVRLQNFFYTEINDSLLLHISKDEVKELKKTTINKILQGNRY